MSATASGASTTGSRPASSDRGFAERSASSAASAPRAAGASLRRVGVEERRPAAAGLGAHREHGGLRAGDRGADVDAARVGDGDGVLGAPHLAGDGEAARRRTAATIAPDRRCARLGVELAGGLQRADGLHDRCGSGQPGKRRVLGRHAGRADGGIAASPEARLSSSRLVLATPTRLPSTARTLTITFSSATFWLMRLLAKRVSALESAPTSTSASSAAVIATVARASSRASRGVISISASHPDLHATEAGGRGAVRHVRDLHRLALAAVGQPPDPPVRLASRSRRTSSRTAA